MREPRESLKDYSGYRDGVRQATDGYATCTINNKNTFINIIAKYYIA